MMLYKKSDITICIKMGGGGGGVAPPVYMLKKDPVAVCGFKRSAFKMYVSPFKT